MVLLASLFTVDVKGNTQTHNSYLAIVPIRTVSMSVRALGRYRGKVFEYDLYHHNRSYSPIYVSCEPGSSVGIVTEQGWTVRNRIPVGTRFSAPVQTGTGAHPASCKMGTGSFPGVKCGRGVLLTTHHLPVPRSWNSRAIPLPTLWATPGPVTGTLYVFTETKHFLNGRK